MNNRDAVQELRTRMTRLEWEISMLKSELNTMRLHTLHVKDVAVKKAESSARTIAPFFGAIELRDGIPYRWHANECLKMSAEEQYKQNVLNGYKMP